MSGISQWNLYCSSRVSLLFSQYLISIDLNQKAQWAVEKSSPTMALAPSLGIYFALL